MTEDEMCGWHHRLNGHELGQTPGDGEGQGSLTCFSPWGREESDTTWQLNKDNSQGTHRHQKGVQEFNSILELNRRQHQIPQVKGSVL